MIDLPSTGRYTRFNDRGVQRGVLALSRRFKINYVVPTASSYGSYLRGPTVHFLIFCQILTSRGKKKISSHLTPSSPIRTMPKESRRPSRRSHRVREMVEAECEARRAITPASTDVSRPKSPKVSHQLIAAFKRENRAVKRERKEKEEIRGKLESLKKEAKELKAQATLERLKMMKHLKELESEKQCFSRCVSRSKSFCDSVKPQALLPHLVAESASVEL